MKASHFLFTTLTLGLLLSCSTKKNTVSLGDQEFKIKDPPGTVEVEDNYYVDKSEVSNLSYLEYLYWNSQVYGYHSGAYQDALPDTQVWNQLNSYKTGNLYRIYFRHPKYRKFPMVGVSWEQAMNYSEWRSNRVYEYLLIKEGLIEPDHEQDSNTVFTIEKYLDGQYYGYSPDSSMPIPRYSLPTEQEWEKLASGGYPVEGFPLGVDTNSRKIKRLQKKSTYLFNSYEFTSHYSSDTVQVFTGDVYSFRPNPFGLYNVIGNVAEMTAEKGIAKGGSWLHTLDRSEITDVIHYKRPAAWLGFRCVCKWELP